MVVTGRFVYPCYVVYLPTLTAHAQWRISSEASFSLPVAKNLKMSLRENGARHARDLQMGLTPTPKMRVMAHTVHVHASKYVRLVLVVSS